MTLVSLSIFIGLFILIYYPVSFFIGEVYDKYKYKFDIDADTEYLEGMGYFKYFMTDVHKELRKHSICKYNQESIKSFTSMVNLIKENEKLFFIVFKYNRYISFSIKPLVNARVLLGDKNDLNGELDAIVRRLKQKSDYTNLQTANAYTQAEKDFLDSYAPKYDDTGDIKEAERKANLAESFETKVFTKDESKVDAVELEPVNIAKEYLK